jgi:hypothetical protein
MHDDVAEGQIIIGDAVVNFELPTPLFSAISKKLKKTKKAKLYTYHSEAVIDLLRSMLEDGDKPPTHRQLAYARTISAVMGIPLTSKILSNGEECSNYLDRHSEAYQEFKNKNSALYEKNKKLISQARRVGKWNKAAERQLLGASKEEAAKLFGVQVVTIEKYQDELNKWCLVAMKDNTYDIVMKLVEALDNDEDMMKYCYVNLDDLIRTEEDH